MISQKEKDIIIQTLDPYNPKRIGIFGSRARNEYTATSDLDLLVALEHVTLLDLVSLENELSRLLNVKVDLITEGALNKNLKPMIEKEIHYFLNNQDEPAKDEER
jgi:uncharacterized protein